MAGGTRIIGMILTNVLRAFFGFGVLSLARQNDEQNMLTTLDAGRVTDLAREAVQALRAAHDHIRIEAKELEVARVSLCQERERLESESEKLAQVRDEFERNQVAWQSNKARIEEQSAKLERQRADMDAARGEMETQKQAFAERLKLSEAEQWKQVEFEQSRRAAADELVKREKALAADKKSLDAAIAALEPQRTEIERLRRTLDARAHDLDGREEELKKTREALAAMQAQLARDHHEIAVQREELLERLGGVASIPAIPANGADRADGTPVVYDETHGTISTNPDSDEHWHPAPKPAVSTAADQFRKLRRDARRKIVGV